MIGGSQANFALFFLQTLTPHMQSGAVNRDLASHASKNYQRTSSSGDEDQVNISLEVWKKAFKDACERLCPLRAGGHECGCLPVLPRLVKSVLFFLTIHSRGLASDNRTFFLTEILILLKQQIGQIIEKETC